MAGHIQDRWYKVSTGPDGKTVKTKSDRFGTGLRYRARYIGPDGTEKSKSFPDKQKRLADLWLTNIEADMARGQYIDPQASRTTFRDYAERWIAALTTDLSSRAAVEGRLRLHAMPYLGGRPIGSFQAEHIRDWSRQLEETVGSASYRRLIFDAVSSVLNAAVDDRLLTSNPCRARSVKAPRPAPTRVHPWSASQVFGVRAGLPERFQAMADVGAGCGLRQGEIFGLAVDNIGDLGWLYVRQQVKKVRGGLVFAPPKRGKVRDVPLDPEVSAALREHMRRIPPVEITFVANAERAEGDAPADLHCCCRHTALEQRFQRPNMEASARVRGGHPGAREGAPLRRGPRARDARTAALLRLGPPGRRREHQGAESLPRAQRSGLHAPGVHAPDAEQRDANP